MIDRYSRPELRALWSDPHRYATWFRVELAALHEMAADGLVPRDAVEACENGAPVFDDAAAARILEIENVTKHDVLAFLQFCEEKIGPPARFLHRGMTSSDVLDTGLALQLVEATTLIERTLDRCLAALRTRAEEHRRTPTIGRSHGIHAEPTTFGLKLAVWYGHLSRARERVAAAKAQVAVGKIAGAVGTHAHLGPELERRALARLGLTPEPVATQVVQRDRHAALFQAFATVATAIEVGATEIRHLMRTEVGEVSEPFDAGQQGSSAMPHKKNPILSENLCGLARVVRAAVVPALEDVPLWHERDISHSSVERLLAPDVTATLHFMLGRYAGLIERLVVYPERMRANLDSTHGLVFSGALLLLLADSGLARQDAYRLVQKHALRAGAERIELRTLVEGDAGITARVAPEALAACFSLDPHLRHVDALFTRAFGDPSIA